MVALSDADRLQVLSNSISALLHKDVEVADRMIARLGDFLRLTLKRSDAQTIDFGQELEFLRCYLDIEHIRFQDRLIVEMEVEPQTLDILVPNLILQPIVENAIRHGIARQTNSGRITIRAFKENDRLIMQVEDNGPGLRSNHNPNGNLSGGIGLSNTRARLRWPMQRMEAPAAVRSGRNWEMSGGSPTAPMMV